MSALHLVLISSLVLATSGSQPTVRYAGTHDVTTTDRRPAAPAGHTEDVAGLSGLGPTHGSPSAAVAGGDMRAPPRQQPAVGFKRTSLCANCDALFDITAFVAVASSGRDLPRHEDYVVSLRDVATSQFHATHDLGPFVCDRAESGDDTTATCASTFRLFVPFSSLGDTGKRDAVVLTSLIRRDPPVASKVVDQWMVAVAIPSGNGGVYVDDRFHSSRYTVTLRDDWLTPPPIQSAANDADAAHATLGTTKQSSQTFIVIECAVGLIVSAAIVLAALILHQLRTSSKVSADDQIEHHAPKKEDATTRRTEIPSPRYLFAHFSESACSPDVRDTRRDSHDAMSSAEGEGTCLGAGAVDASSPNSDDRGGDSVDESSASPRSAWTSGDEDGERGTAPSELEIYVYSPKSVVDDDDGDVAHPLPCSNTLSASSELDESYCNSAEESESKNEDSRKPEASMLNVNGIPSIEDTQHEDPLPNSIQPKIDGEGSLDDDENDDANGGKAQAMDSPNMPISTTKRSFNSASTDQIANRWSLPAPLESNCESAPSLSRSSTGGECKDNECLADQRLQARVSTSPIDRIQLRSSPDIQMRTNQSRGNPADEKSALNPTWDSLDDFGEPNDGQLSPNQRTSPSTLRKSPEEDKPIASSSNNNCDGLESRSCSQRPSGRSEEALSSYSSPTSTTAATVGEFAEESAARDRPVPVRCGVNGQKRLGVSTEELHVSTTARSEIPLSPAPSGSDLRRKYRKQRKIEKQLVRTVKTGDKHRNPEALAHLSQNISLPAWEYNAKPSREQSY